MARRYISIRAVIIGCVMAVGIGLAEPYLTIYMKSSYLFTDYHYGGASFLIVVVFLLFNMGLSRVRRSWALRTEELLVVCALMIVAGSVVTSGCVVHLIPMMSSAYYFATPGNHWETDLVPHLKSWLAPLDPDGGMVAIRKFWTGIAHEAPIPWGPWVEPVLLWGLYLMALFAFMGALMVLMRRQWMDNEHLSYTIAQIPTELCVGLSDPHAESSIFRSRAFWIGLGIMFALHSATGLRHYATGVASRIRIDEQVLLAPGFRLRFWVEVAVVGLVFMIPNRIAFSVWFFTLVSWLMRSVIRLRGWGMQENLAWGGPAEMQHMVVGALLVFVGAGLWYSRGHLKRAVLCALGRGDPDYDSNEPASYRAVFLTMLLAGIIMLVWLWRSGLSLPVALLFLVLLVFFYYAMARIIAQIGLPSASSIMSVAPYVSSLIGPSVLGRSQVAALGNQFWNTNVRNTPAVGTSQGMYLPDRRRGLYAGMMVCLVLAYLAAAYCVIRTGYRHGASSLSTWFVVNSSRVPWWWYSGVASKAHGLNVVGLGWSATGVGIMAVLTIAQRTFFWWPLHPIAFLVCNTIMVYNFWFSIFLAWLIKAMVVRLGGYRIYRITRRFFIGLVLGGFMAGGVWAVLDLIFDVHGNQVFAI